MLPRLRRNALLVLKIAREGRMDIQGELKRIFEVALVQENIADTDDILLMSGGSLPVVAITSLIRRNLKVDVDVADIFKAPTIQRLAKVIEEKVRSAGTAPEPAEATRSSAQG